MLIRKNFSIKTRSISEQITKKKIAPFQRTAPLKRIAKIVPPIKMGVPQTPPFTPIKMGRQAVITPVTTPFTLIAIEKERKAVISAVAPVVKALKATQDIFIKKFRLPIGLADYAKYATKNEVLGQVAPSPKAMIVTKRIAKVTPQQLKRGKRVTPQVLKATISTPVHTLEPVKADSTPVKMGLIDRFFFWINSLIKVK